MSVMKVVEGGLVEIDYSRAKICARCRWQLPGECFGTHSRTGDGFQPYCRECTRSVANARQGAATAWLAAYKLERGCQECGARPSDARALSFDHVDPLTKWSRGVVSKHKQQAIKRTWSRKRIVQEVAKCRVLCADCHHAKSVASGDYVPYAYR